MSLGRRRGLTPEQEKAIRLWVWGESEGESADDDRSERKKGEKKPRKSGDGIKYYSTYSELAKAVGVDTSQISRWFKYFPEYIAEYERQLAARNSQDDTFYLRVRQKAQRVLEKNLSAPYARDSTAAALAILGRCGDVDGVRVEVQGMDVDRVIRGGYGRSQADE